MASVATQTKTGQTSPPSPSQRPIDILPEQISFFASNLHPIVLLSVLLFSFGSLVKNPVATLLGLAPTIAIIQLAYCVLSLPTSNQTASSASSKLPGQKRKKSKGDLSFKLVPAFLSLFLTIFLSAPVLFIAVILFGGPLVSDTFATLLLALHFALLTTPQLYYAHGLDSQIWLRIASLQMAFDEVYGMSVGACVGAWLGAIPIPLDWDRDWQRWPVTVLTGVYIGAVIGKIVGGHLLKGYRLKIT